MLASVLPSESNVIEDNKLTLTGNVMADRPEGDSPRRGETAPGTVACKQSTEPSARKSGSSQKRLTRYRLPDKTEQLITINNLTI